MEFSKNNAKYIRSLQIKKYRDKFNNFVAEGDKICLEMLRSKVIKIEMIICTESWQNDYSDELAPFTDLIRIATDKQMKEISSLRTPTRIFIVAKQREAILNQIDWEHSWTLYLDGIQDPGNLGTILRIADWFGLKGVGISPDSADFYNPKVIQATMGAFLRVPSLKCTLEEILADQSKAPMIYGADMHGNNVFDNNPRQAGILVIGNEGKGIRPATKTLVKEFVSIPGQAGTQGAESLNAAVACGILTASLLNIK